MHWLAELIIELISWLIPSPGQDSRSAMGESDLDREARRLWIGIVATLIAIAVAIGLWLHFRG